MNLPCEEIVRAVQSVTGPTAASLHEPTFGGKEWEYIKECLDTACVSTAGSYVAKFEDMLCSITGARYVIATNTGTAALHVCLLLSEARHDDEILLPSITFVATANAVMYCGGIPHFVDIDEKTFGVDPAKLRSYLEDIAEIRDGACYNSTSGRRIRALIAMHTFGHPCDLEELAALCRDYHIDLVEDAAEAIGSYYHDRHVGNWGRVSALSFNGNKVVTTGGGGAIMTNDRSLAEMARRLTDTGKVPHPWEKKHDLLAFNYRMPNINAALGCAQMEQLDHFITQKRRLAELYATALESIDGVSFFLEASGCKSNYWLNSIVLDAAHACERDRFLEITNQAGIRTQPTWTPMHHLPMYASFPRMDLETSESLFDRIINLPSSPSLTIN